MVGVVDGVRRSGQCPRVAEDGGERHVTKRHARHQVEHEVRRAHGVLVRRHGHTALELGRPGERWPAELADEANLLDVALVQVELRQRAPLAARRAAGVTEQRAGAPRAIEGHAVARARGHLQRGQP